MDPLKWFSSGESSCFNSVSKSFTWKHCKLYINADGEVSHFDKKRIEKTILGLKEQKESEKIVWWRLISREDKTSHICLQRQIQIVFFFKNKFHFIWLFGFEITPTTKYKN